MNITCPDCDRVNAARRSFCGGCGRHLRTVCNGCAFENSIDDHFCGGCGQDFGTHDSARVITFADTAHPTDDEMSALISSPPVELETKLPESGIVQADVDRLFGALQ